MRGFRALVSAWVCGVGMTAAAHAADPPRDWFPLPDFKKRNYTELVSGWYARADIGYRKQTIGSVDAPPPNLVTQWALQSVPTFGIGGGYKHHWFRADVTLDYGTLAKFRGDTAAVPGYYRAKIDAFTLLANVYLDLGEWGGFTPYVGVGGGTSNLRTDQYSNITIVSPPDGVNESSRWSFSWAAMGGVSYRVSPNLLLDVGYRYLKLGTAQSGTEPPAYTTRTYFRDISAQEIRVGLRWVLD